jgi:methyl-accepting chemotaxis protein
MEDPSASTRGVVVFFVAAVAGMAFIVLAKLGSLSQLGVTAVPVAILLAYAYALFRWRRLTLRDDQSGDNLYYLGFLYTLTSVAVSLYQFSLGEHAQEQIITNFGIAIATTIVGLALRVMFNQMRQDPAEVERVARIELAEASRRLRREIDLVVMELNVFRRTTQQSLTDNQRSVQDGLAETLKDAARSFVDLSKTMRSEFSESIGVLAKASASLSETTEDADDALADFGERLASLKTSDLLLEQLAPSVSKAEVLIEEVRQAHTGQAERLNAVITAIDSAASSMQQSARVMADLMEKRVLDFRQPRWKRAFDWLAGRAED